MMQPLGLFLILLSVGAFAAPVSGIILMHTDDLSEVIIPENLEEILADIANEEAIELPQYVSSSVDPDTRTAQVILSFTNSFEFDLSLNTLVANVRCVDHNVLLGHAELEDQVEIEQGETQQIVVNFVWTGDAEEHFLEEHIDETAVDVKLVDIEVDVSGIVVEVPDEVVLTLPIADEG
jgi:hypothetical protein